MRVLLVAYEFPPSRSPRALRWQYLVRELALLGHEVHVLLPDLGEPGFAFPQAPGQVVLHPTFAGPLGWFAARSRSRAVTRDPLPAPSHAGQAIGLNWRGRMMEWCKRFAGLLLFPDVRAEWKPWARRMLHELIASVAPDVIVTSHEPASTLPLGARARQAGIPWVADLGDPVCAPYTPRRWRRRANALEREVHDRADLVVVTHEAAGELLERRHGPSGGRIVVLANGYDDRAADAPVPSLPFDEGTLELAYAGRLYGYRDPVALLDAVAQTPGVRLTLVVPDPPTGGAAAITAAAGERVRVVGSRPHPEAVAILKGADVLVNFGNRGMPAQIPAKVYEYLGFERPVLHVGTGDGDLAADFLQGLRRGWTCPDDPARLSRLLAELRDRKRAGTLLQGLDLAPLAHYAHSSRGRRLEAMLEGAIASTRNATVGPSGATGMQSAPHTSI